MKKHITLTLLAAVCVTFLPACGNGRIRSVHTVAVNTNITRPKAMVLTNQASANVDAFGGPTTGLLPALVLAGVHHAVITKPRREITAAMESHSIAIETIVPAAFSDTLARSGIFSVAPSGAADATLNLKIIQYGLNHVGGAWTSSGIVPTVLLEARLVGSDGSQIKKLMVGGRAGPHLQEQYRDNPELLRTGWDQAAHVAASVLIKTLAVQMGLPPPNQSGYIATNAASRNASNTASGAVITVSDPRDVKLLRRAEGAKMGDTTLPSGKYVPAPSNGTEWRVRQGKLVLEECKPN